MAGDESEARRRRRRRSVAVCLPSCFGGHRPKAPVGSEAPSPRRRRLRSASWWMLRRKASGRTVPVDAAVVDKELVREKIKEEIREVEGPKKAAQPAGEQAEAGEKARKVKSICSKLHHEPQKHSDETCRKPQAPAPPDKRPARSASFPPSARRPPPPTPSTRGPLAPPRAFDPVVGLSVLIVALAILLAWGRLCAIFCTSAWFYFAPRLRHDPEPIGAPTKPAPAPAPADPDVDSLAYKKKVVLEGLLERSSHRGPPAVL